MIDLTELDRLQTLWLSGPYRLTQAQVIFLINTGRVTPFEARTARSDVARVLDDMKKSEMSTHGASIGRMEFLND